VVAEVLVSAVVVLACLSGVWLWSRLTAARNARVIGAPADGSAQPGGLFRGGMMGRHLLTSGTLVRLEFFDWGVRLGGAFLVRRIIPVWEARYEDLAIAELVTLPHSRITVWLRLRGGSGAIGFLTQDHQQILAMLRDRGVPVNRVVTQVRRVQELYQ
jgi:hypothetical protein